MITIDELIKQAFAEDVAGLDVRHQQDVGLARHRDLSGWLTEVP